jgi:hypothetical protein
MKMVPTEVTGTSTLSLHTPGNYPKEENTRYSQHGESLKTRLRLLFYYVYANPNVVPHYMFEQSVLCSNEGFYTEGKLNEIYVFRSGSISLRWTVK